MYIQLMNILLRTCMQKMNLTLLGRNYFDPENKQQLKQFKIECWPGYVTSIRQHEQNLLMNVETATKILRLDTALDQMRELQRSIKDLAQLKSAVARLLIGNIVITRYNNKTYRIDDIDWECNPNTTFEVCVFLKTPLFYTLLKADFFFRPAENVSLLRSISPPNIRSKSPI